MNSWNNSYFPHLDENTLKNFHDFPYIIRKVWPQYMNSVCDYITFTWKPENFLVFNHRLTYFSNKKNLLRFIGKFGKWCKFFIFEITMTLEMSEILKYSTNTTAIDAITINRISIFANNMPKQSDFLSRTPTKASTN